ncbi:MAG: WXG100 family type VII secretion target [Bacilli bacterium]|nr:WXG100 family type VII secretion target [Bacilli bacterium]
MVLKASPEEIRTAGKNLVGNAESYLGSVKALYETVDNLQQNWQGADNVKFAQTVNSYKENINALGQVIGNYGVFLQETANSLEKLQAEIAQQASNL